MIKYWLTENYINESNVTISNMGQLLKGLQSEKEALDICEKHSFKPDFLKKLLLMKMKGYNNQQVAQRLGVHRVTIQRYVLSLRKLKESEFQKIKEYIFGAKDDTTN